MKTFIKLFWIKVFILFASLNYCYCQKKIEEAILLASQNQNIKVDTVTIDYFVSIFNESKQQTKASLEEMPTNILADRISKYLIAKKIEDKEQPLRPEVIRDFNWSDVANNSSWVSVKAPGSAKVWIVEIGDSRRISETGFNTKANEWIAIPAENFSLEAIDKERGSQRWEISGVPMSKVLELFFSESKGCEVYVNSDPSSALVYFNEKKYYRETNTSSVREAGKLKVVIHKDGYDQWLEEKTLKVGEVWQINATLKKKKR